MSHVYQGHTTNILSYFYRQQHWAKISDMPRARTSSRMSTGGKVPKKRVGKAEPEWKVGGYTIVAILTPSFHFTSNWQDGLEEITGACIKTKGTWVCIHFRLLRKFANILLSSIIKWRSVQLEALTMQLTRRTFDTIMNSKWHNYDGPKTYVPYMTLWAAKHSPQGGNPKQTSFQQIIIQPLPCILFKIFGTKSALTTYPIRCYIRGVDVLN